MNKTSIKSQPMCKSFDGVLQSILTMDDINSSGFTPVWIPKLVLNSFVFIKMFLHRTNGSTMKSAIKILLFDKSTCVHIWKVYDESINSNILINLLSIHLLNKWNYIDLFGLQRSKSKLISFYNDVMVVKRGTLIYVHVIESCEV